MSTYRTNSNHKFFQMEARVLPCAIVTGQPAGSIDDLTLAGGNGA